jgi:hypothetical protein
VWREDRRTLFYEQTLKQYTFPYVRTKEIVRKLWHRGGGKHGMEEMVNEKQ